MLENGGNSEFSSTVVAVRRINEILGCNAPYCGIIVVAVKECTKPVYWDNVSVMVVIIMRVGVFLDLFG